MATYSNPNYTLWKYGIVGVIGLVLFFILNPFVVVGPGERGVVTNFGAVQKDVLGEGLHLRMPIMQKVVIMDVKVQKGEGQRQYRDLFYEKTINAQIAAEVAEGEISQPQPMEKVAAVNKVPAADAMRFTASEKYQESQANLVLLGGAATLFLSGLGLMFWSRRARTIKQ